MARNISMLEKTLWKRKEPRELKTIGTPQRNYMNYRTK
jgi:hypothetical protein